MHVCRHRLSVVLLLVVGALAWSRPAAAEDIVRPGRVRLGFGLTLGSGTFGGGLSVGYAVSPYVVPGVTLSGRLSNASPDVASATAGVTFYLRREGGVLPFAEVSGGRLFVGGGGADAWNAGAGAGVLLRLGPHAGLAVGVAVDRYWYEDGHQEADVRPILGLSVFY